MKKLILILTILLFASPVWGACTGGDGDDCFVDCAVADGPGGTGTFADPFESVDDVLANSFSSGEDLYFLAGSECIEDANSSENDTLIIDWANATVGCYWDDAGSPNTDCTGKTKPIINHYVGVGSCAWGDDDWSESGGGDIEGSLCSNADGRDHGIKVDSDGVTIQDIVIKNVVKHGIAYSWVSAITDNLTVQRVEIHDTGKGLINSNCTAEQGSLSTNPSATVLTNTSESKFSVNEFQGGTLVVLDPNDNYSEFGEWTITSNTATTITVTGADFYNDGIRSGDVYYVHDCGSNLTVEYIEGEGWGRLAEECATGSGSPFVCSGVLHYRTFPNGIMGSGNGPKIRYNYLYDGYGEGITCRYTSRDCIAEHNFVINTASRCVYAGAQNGATIRGNLCIGTENEAWHLSEGSTGDCDGLGAGRGCRSPPLYNSRSWAQGIETSSDADPEDIDKFNHYIYGNVVIGNFYGLRFANGKGEILDVIEAHNNLLIDNYYQIHTWNNYDPVMTNVSIKNNISAIYEQTDSRTVELRLEDNATNPDWMDGWVTNNNYWCGDDTDATGETVTCGTQTAPECSTSGGYDSSDCALFDDATDQHGNNPTGKRDDAYWQEFTTIANLVANFATSQIYLETNSNDAIGNGIDLGGTATCADIDNLDDNCGFVMDTSTKWEDLATTATFDWCDQEDPSDIGPWTYTCDSPQLPSNEASMGGS